MTEKEKMFAGMLYDHTDPLRRIRPTGCLRVSRKGY